MAGCHASLVARRRCMLASASHTCGKRASRRRTSRGWHDTGRRLATRASALLESNLFHLERCLGLVWKASRDHGRYDPPPPQTCRRPCCSDLALMTLLDHVHIIQSTSGAVRCAHLLCLRRRVLLPSARAQHLVSYPCGDSRPTRARRRTSRLAIPTSRLHHLDNGQPCQHLELPTS